MIAAAVIALFLGQAGVELVDPPPPEWVAEHAPYGFDVTPDGHIWINVNEVGQRDDYAVLSSDLRSQTGDIRTVWIRGYHKRNPAVKYRETRARYQFWCKDRQVAELHHTALLDGMTVYSTRDGYRSSQNIIPGSHADYWHRMVCKKR